MQSSVPSGSTGTAPLGNINGEVTMQQLLANTQLVPGMRGAYLRVEPGQGIRFADLSQLTIDHKGAEFLLTREVVETGTGTVRRWRIYSGTPDQVLPPRFLRQSGSSTIVERVVGHTHPFPLPFEPGWNQPSLPDIRNLKRIQRVWRQVYGPQSEPFGRVIGLPGESPTIYGPQSTPGNAVLPSQMRR